MTHEHAPDVFIGPDGRREQQPLVVESGDAQSIRDKHDGSVCVHEGGVLTIERTAAQNGSLRLESGARAVVRGSVNGSLSVARDAVVEISGRQNGSVHIERGGEVVVSSTGRLAGSLEIDGLVQNGGTRGGSVRGSGELIDLPGAVVKQPVLRGGASYFEW